MITGVIFDMDGLMFDTETLTYQIWQEIMDSENYAFNIEIFKQTIGLRTVETMRFYQNLYGEGFDYQPLRERSLKLFWNHVNTNGLPVKEGLFELLEHLKTNGIKTAVATSTTSKTAVPMLKNARVTQYFDDYVCGDMVANSKPHPEVFLTAAGKLGLPPEECIALEDSINGIKSAYSANTKPIMIPDFLQPTEEIKPMLYAVCDNLKEVIQYI